ncbi:MAG: hypothetical protein KC933_22220 [Myxococcales bacterium]|nr:hypothetical protein [Myxococcales bacterium]
MNTGPKIPPIVLWLVSLALPAVLVIVWLRSAQAELNAAPESTQDVAVASMTDDDYCTADLKRVLRRVAGACGLLAGAGRGCQPSDAKTVAQMNDADFNALFGPMKDRTQIIQFDADDTTLDEVGRKAVEQAVEDDPALVQRRDIRGDYETLWRVTYDIRDKYAKKYRKEDRWKRDKIIARQKDQEIFEKTRGEVDRLYTAIFGR